MILVLEVEYLSGVSFAATGPDSDAPDWPPQPDRIFSALTAAWAARGESDEERQALEWLEALPAPRVLASPAEPRTAPVVFVPPNDPSSGKQKSAKGVLPALRRRQPRRFPAARPHDPVIRLFWTDAEPKDGTVAALQRLASDTAYLGHSSSLTRCRFLSAEEPPGEGRFPRRGIYPGRLDELRRSFEAGRRPLPGTRVAPQPETPVEGARSLFGQRWLHLEHVLGDMPDIRASALMAKTLRDALLSGYRRIGLGDRIPEVVSGHAPDGSPSSSPHLATIPLSFTGFPHADGHVLGLALVPPHDAAILEDDDFRRALRSLAPIDEELGRRILTLKLKSAATGFGSLMLCPAFEAPSGRRSLDPAVYLGPSRTLATVTPIALDRHLKEMGEAREQEIESQIANACRNIGLPEPERIVANKHSAHEGAPSAYPSGKSPFWMRWHLPKTLASRQLTHAVIRFAEPVAGPVILGAGRFLGLGLCRPLGREER